MPFGARAGGDGACFRLWAPGAETVSVRLGEGAEHAMARDAEGFFQVTLPGVGAGTHYRYVADGRVVPDPASRFQPDGVHGPSEVVDPAAFPWQDEAWRGRPWHEAVVYELHVGSFTPEGTFRALIPRLPALAALGVTAIELMPLAEFPGTRGWGYDGVLPFAPSHNYGRPEDLKALVEAAHRHGLMVLLDVVYNHFGPEGNHLHAYAPQFFNPAHPTPWGAAINFDAPGCTVVRDFFIHNALYWLEEYHLDGLRLDAVHAIRDDSPQHVLDELATRVRAALPDRRVHLVLENDANQARFLTGPPAGYDAQWNDDFHHVLHVLLTGETHGYYADYAGEALALFGRCLAHGFAWQGEHSGFRGRARGEPSAHLPPTRFVAFAQNHDQVGNRALGERLSTLAETNALRAALTVLLLAPQVPLLFMGEEWGAVEPFLFFCDLGTDLHEAVREGRRREFESFPDFSDPRRREAIPDPIARSSFEASRPDWDRRRSPEGEAWLRFYGELLALRAHRVTPWLAGAPAGQAHWQCDEGVLRVRWPLAGGCLLSLLFTAGAGAASLLPIPAGSLLCCTGTLGAAARGVQPGPWTAAFWLSERA